MPYLAILQTDEEEFISINESPIKAKLAVYEGYNTFLKKVLETQHKNPLVDVTSEWLSSRLDKYYRHYLGGKVGIDTVERKWNLGVLEMEYGKCYRDGSETPTREQEY